MAHPPATTSTPASAVKAVCGADLVIAELLRREVPFVVGIPGGAILPLYDALAQSPLRHVLARHEQGAAFVAQGAARVNGRAGVCLATSGPGATNLITAIADAKADSVPLVAITAQVPRALIGTDAFQEVDTCALVRPITKGCFQARTIEELAELLPRVFELAEQGRPGPVLLDIPKDVLTERYPEPLSPGQGSAPPSELRGATRDSMIRAVTRSTPETDGRETSGGAKRQATPNLDTAFKTAAAWLNESQRPLLYVGGGIHLAGATQELAALVAKSDVPVVSSLLGLGALDSRDAHWLGMLGMHGAPFANLATDEADLVIALGVRFDDRATGNPKTFCKNARIVHIDIDPRELGKLRAIELGIVADVKHALAALAAHVLPKRRPGWLSRLAELQRTEPLPDSNEVKPLMLALNAALPEDCIVTTDVGQHQMWVAQWLDFSARRKLLTSGGLGTMGFGLPAAIGAALAAPERRVACVTGDGSFLMNIQELALLAELSCNVCVVILNNAQLGMVRQQQQLFYAERYSASVYAQNPDFVTIARGFGVRAARLSVAEFCRSGSDYLATPGPLLLDIDLQPDNVMPMVPPGRSNQEMIRFARA